MPSITKTILQKLAACFLAGLFAILPLVITVAIVIWVAGFLGELIGPGTLLGNQLQRLGMNFSSESANQTLAYCLGWLLVLGAVFVVGVLIQMGAKRILSRLMDTIVSRIPLVVGIYGTSKQLVGMLDKKDEADLKGMSVVFCMFGAQHGCGLLALLVSPEKYCIADREYYIVIVPTAPVPVGGGLFFVPTDSVVQADLSVDALMSVYVSMGVTAPEFMSTSTER